MAECFNALVIPFNRKREPRGRGDALEDHAGSVVLSENLLQRVKIVVGHMRVRFRVRGHVEEVRKAGVARLHRDAGGAVEGAVEGYDPRAFCRTSCELDRRIVCLPAAVQHVDVMHVRRGDFQERLAQVVLVLRGEVVIAGIDFLCPVNQRLHDLGISVPQVEDAAVAVHVDVGVAVKVRKAGPLPLTHHHLDAKGAEQVDLVRVPDSCCGFIDLMRFL